MLKNSLYYILLFFVLCIIVYTQIVQANYDIIDNDDFFFMFDYVENFLNSYIVNAYHGRFITNTLTILIGSILPLSLDIHPNCWIQTFGAGIKAIFVFIICYLLSSSLFVFDKKINKYKKLCICIFTLFFYLLYQNRFTGQYQNVLYMSFYGFTLPFIIYFFFWENFIKFFCDNNNEKNNKQTITFCILSFLIGCSSEFFSFSTFCSLTILMIWLFFDKHRNILKYIPIYISMFFGFLLYVLNPGFRDTAADKGWVFSNFSSVYKEWFTEVIDNLTKVLFSDFIYIFLIIIVLFIALFFLKIENKKRKILILSLYILGVICFYLSMMFVRQDFLENYLYIVHFDIVVQVQIALIFVILLQISFLSEYNNLKNILTIILFICLLCLMKENFVDAYNLIIKQDKANYILKYANNEPDYIINRYKSEYILLENIKDGKKIYSLDDLLNGELRPNSSNGYDYIKTIYNFDLKYDDSQMDYITSIEQLYEKFLNDGGKPISQEELDKHNFNVLLKRYRKNN